MSDRVSRLQVMLVSEQAAPNILAALDPDLKPDEAVLVVTDKMQLVAERLKSVLTSEGIRVQVWPLSNEADFRACQEQLLDLAAELEGRSVSVNLTGGTKLIAFAALSVSEQAHWRPFYVDLDSDTVRWLDDESEVRPLRQQLRLSVYLQCRFQKTAALNVRSRLHYSSGGVGSIRQRRAAAGQERPTDVRTRAAV